MCDLACCTSPGVSNLKTLLIPSLDDLFSFLKVAFAPIGYLSYKSVENTNTCIISCINAYMISSIESIPKSILAVLILIAPTIGLLSAALKTQGEANAKNPELGLSSD